MPQKLAHQQVDRRDEGNHVSKKLLEIINPVKIDSYCNSCVISKVSPYSAPEILLRDKVYAECDFYSLGIIIYEMMTQDVPLLRFR